MSNYLGDNKLRFLQTKYNYGKLDSGRDTCKYDMFYTEAKNILKSYEGLENDSDKILRALCYVYKNKLSGTLQSNMCNFLYFWLGTILLDKMRNKVVFFDVILNIFNTLKNDNIGKFCNLPHYYINENNFKKIKLFFDYSEDYNSYKQHLNKNNHLCNKKYKTYLETYVNSYKNARDECAENPNPNSYCKEFNQYFKDKDDNLLSKWKCELQEHGKEELELEEEQEEDVAEKSLLSPGHGNGLHTGTIPNEDSSEIRQEENHPGSSVYHSGDGISDLNNISNLPDDSSPSTMKKSITSAVSAAGVLVPPFLIYNYTPAGTWISKLLGRNKGPTRNPYANPELMADFYQPEEFYSERNRYNIMYNPE